MKLAYPEPAECRRIYAWIRAHLAIRNHRAERPALALGKGKRATPTALALGKRKEKAPVNAY